MGASDGVEADIQSRATSRLPLCCCCWAAGKPRRNTVATRQMSDAVFCLESFGTTTRDSREICTTRHDQNGRRKQAPNAQSRAHGEVKKWFSLLCWLPNRPSVGTEQRVSSLSKCCSGGCFHALSTYPPLPLPRSGADTGISVSFSKQECYPREVCGRSI